MSDLHEARRPEREPQIDTVGWLFLAVAVAITAAAAMVAYDGNEAAFGNAATIKKPTRGEGNHGKCCKAYFWRRNCSREHRNSSIGCP